MVNRVVKGGGAAPEGGSTPSDSGSATPAAAPETHKVFKAGNVCTKCCGCGQVRYKDPRGVDTVATCQDCQPGKV